MSTGPAKRCSAEEYLTFERASEEKHEFVDGEIRLMSGATRAHNLISTNLAVAVGSQLADKPCEVYLGDMRVKVDADGRYTYPDMSIVCEEPRFEDDTFDTLLNPGTLVEVLSKSTAAYDRGDKFTSYRNLPSLNEYLLVEQLRPHVEHFVRLDDGGWRFNPIEGLEGAVTLVTAEVTLPLAEIYAKVRFDADA